MHNTWVTQFYFDLCIFTWINTTMFTKKNKNLYDVRPTSANL